MNHPLLIFTAYVAAVVLVFALRSFVPGSKKEVEESLGSLLRRWFFISVVLTALGAFPLSFFLREYLSSTDLWMNLEGFVEAVGMPRRSSLVHSTYDQNVTDGMFLLTWAGTMALSWLGIVLWALFWPDPKRNEDQ